MTYYGRWSYKIEEAARQGAAGVLLVHDADALGYGWRCGAATPGPGASSSSRAADAHAPRAVEGWMQKDAARALFARPGSISRPSRRPRRAPDSRRSGMGLRVDATLHNSVRQFSSANVIALCPAPSAAANM